MLRSSSWCRRLFLSPSLSSKQERMARLLLPHGPAALVVPAQRLQVQVQLQPSQVRCLATSRQKRSGKYVPPKRRDKNKDDKKAKSSSRQHGQNDNHPTTTDMDDGQILWTTDGQAHEASELVKRNREKKLLLPTTDLSQFKATPSMLQDTPYTTLSDLQKGAAATTGDDDGTAATTTPASTLSTISDLGALRDLYNPALHLGATAPTDWTDYEAATPLWQEMAAWIGVAGRPISVADYMRLCNTHPAYGYYTQAASSSAGGAAPKEDEFDDNEWDSKDDEKPKDNLIIGPHGDFVTAPEMSQIFGECLGIWCMTVWQLANPGERPTSWQWLEAGPGRGSLVVDLMRFGMSVDKIRDSFGNGCRGIHLIEASPKLRQVQRETLVKEVGHLVQFTFPQQNDEAATTKKEPQGEATDKPTIPVYWHDALASFSLWQKENDSYLATFGICQEFLDALPVYAFEKTNEGWRERLVDIAMREDIDLEEYDDKAAAAAAAARSAKDSSLDRLKHQKKPRLRLVTAPEVTPAAKTLLQVDPETGLMPNEDPPVDVGSVMEVNPEGILFVQELARIVDTQGGGALVIDYGQEGSTDSIRAFARHEQVHFLSRPGQVDVTADVDFAALKHGVNALELPRNTQAFGPVRQGDFLMSMGAQDRAIHLIEIENTSAEDAENIYQALVRLCDPAEMGERFKVLAIARKKDGIFQPPGF